MTSKQARTMKLLESGSRYSVIDITVRLHIGDPRSVVRDLRKMGVEVKDAWYESADGGRYKRYWIENTPKYGK